MASPKLNSQDRAAFSPGEFAALFGKSQTWGYRQIYAGKVKPVTEYGRLLIPAAEVDRILATAGIYDGKKSKAPRTKAVIKKLQPKLGTAWQGYLAARSGNEISSGKEIVAALRAGRTRKGATRESAIKRLSSASQKR